jgi:hypothetical protein
MRTQKHLLVWFSYASLGLVSALSVAANAAEPATPAGSTGSGSEKSATAQILFDEAVRSMDEGKVADACPKFKRSFELDPKSSTLGNLGACYESIGKVGSAWAAYQELSAYARIKGRSEWAERAEARIADLTPKLMRIVLRVDHASKDFQLEKDGTATTRDEWQIPLVVDPGIHKLDGSAVGFLPWHGEIDCSEAGKTYTVNVPALVKAPEPPKPHVPTPPTRTAGYIALGVGGAGLITGGVFGVLAKSTYTSAVKAGSCKDATELTALCDDAVAANQKKATAETFATVSTAAFIAGAVLATAGIALIVVSKDKTAPKLSFVPSAERAGGGLMAIGSF